MVWDEIVAFLLVCSSRRPLDGRCCFRAVRFFISSSAADTLFRQQLARGLGVMFDDLLAAGYALLCMALIRSVLP